MKIVLVDGFNRDSVADTLIAENVNPQYGELIIKLLNQQASESDYYVLKSDDYKLSRGMEDLI
jgi:hypothetical protein